MSEFRRRLMMQGGKDYEIIDHILTNGLAYIDTGYSPNPYTEVELYCRMEANDYTVLVEDTSAFYSVKFEQGYAFQFNQGNDNAANFFSWANKFYNYGGIIQAFANPSYKSDDILLGWRFENSLYVAYVGDKSRTITSPTHTFAGTLRIFTDNAGLIYRKTDLYFYHFKIMEQGQVIKHFVPAKKGDIYGMAEIIEGKFYASPNGESFSY